MNNNNYGFTLIEVLAVIVVLGFITTLFIPNALKILEDNNVKIYKIKEKELVNAAEQYALYSGKFNPPTSSQERYVMMPELVSFNYMNKILDNKTGNECKAFVKVTLNDIYGYNYDACLICDGYKSNSDFCELSIYNSL